MLARVLAFLSFILAIFGSVITALFYRNKSKQDKEHLRTVEYNRGVLLKASEAAKPIDYDERQEIEKNAQTDIDNGDIAKHFNRRVRNKPRV